MTLKKFNEILEKSKKSTYETIKDHPNEIDYAIYYFNGHFQTALLYEIFKSKNGFCNETIEKAQEAWLTTEHEIRTLKFEKDFLDIVKEFLNRR